MALSNTTRVVSIFATADEQECRTILDAARAIMKQRFATGVKKARKPRKARGTATDNGNGAAD
jgi:hypothetical protein